MHIGPNSYVGDHRSMPKFVISNLDCEYAWRYGTSWTPNTALQGLMKGWSHILRVIPGWEDAVALDWPWEVSGEWLAWGEDARLGQDVSTTVQANSKETSIKIEQMLGLSLPNTLVTQCLETIQEHTRNGEWLVKHPLGVSGRERVEVRDGDAGNGWAWIERTCLESVVIVEPRVQLRTEWSLQFDLGDEVKYLGGSLLITDSLGQHRGHRLDREPGPSWVDDARWAVTAIHQMGYRGPCGVDAFEGFLGEKAIYRPVVEINARWTFGRVALELRRFAPKGPVVWWHPSKRQGRLYDVRNMMPLNTNVGPGLFRLPEFVDPGGASKTIVIVGEQEILRTLPARPSLTAAGISEC